MAMTIEERMATLRSWTQFLETERARPVDDLELQIPLMARDAVERAGRGADPDVQSFDRALLQHAEELAPACAWFDPGRAGRGWWWFLDEILAGRRPRPEVG